MIEVPKDGRPRYNVTCKSELKYMDEDVLLIIQIGHSHENCNTI